MILSVFLLMCSLTFIKGYVDMSPNSPAEQCPDVDMQPSYFTTLWPVPINASNADGIIYPSGRTYSNLTLLRSGLYPRQGDLGRQFVYSAAHTGNGQNKPFISNYSYYAYNFSDGIVIRIGHAAGKIGNTIISPSTTKAMKKIYPALLLGSAFGKFPSSGKLGYYINHTLIILPEDCGRSLSVLYCTLIPRAASRCPAFDSTYISYVLTDPVNCRTSNMNATLNSFKMWFNLDRCHFWRQYNITEDEKPEWFGITQDANGVHLYTSRINGGLETGNLFEFDVLPIYDRLKYYTVMPRSNPASTNDDREAWAANYIYSLSYGSYLLDFDLNGVITRAVDCGADDLSQLMCSYNSFDVDSGIYSVSSFEAKPQGSFIESVYEGNECDFTKLFIGQVPQPYEFGRLVFTNCNYNFTKLLSYFQVNTFQCQKVTPESIATGCYSSLTVDWFAYRVEDKSDLLPGSSSDLQRFNYKPTYSNPTCLISAYTNLVPLGGVNPTNYTTLTNCYGCVDKDPANPWGDQICIPEFVTEVEPGFRPKPSCARVGLEGHISGNDTYSAIVTNGELDSTGDPIWRKGVALTKQPIDSSRADLAFFVSVQIDAQSSSVCPLGAPKSNHSAPPLDRCIEYELYGVIGTGVFQVCNATGVREQRFVYDRFDNLVGYFANNGFYYCISPCVSVPVSVIYDKDSNTHATLFSSVACTHITSFMSQFSRETQSLLRRRDVGPLQSPVGCLIGFFNSSELVEDCNLPLGQSLCAIPPSPHSRTNSGFALSLIAYPEPIVVPVINASTFVASIPTNFTFGVTQEFIETSIQKVTVDCKQYVCNGFFKCEQLLNQYGQFCSKINLALHGANLQQDDAQKLLFSNIKTSQSQPFQAGFGGPFNLSLLEPLNVQTSQYGYRSAIEDLLFNKITIADPGYMQGYDECMKQGPQSARDLICAQFVAGYKVLPPLYDPNMEAAYTASLLGSIAGVGYTAGLSSFAAIPFAQSIFYRMNGIGITQQVLSENQKLIANKFNQALGAMQTGFTSTNMAFAKVQEAVNANAQALSKLASELSNTFGAISSSIGEILKRLDVIEQEVQIDRLINGRLTTLNAFVAQQLVRSETAARSAQLAQDKVNECVKSQSLRQGFCGSGTHIVSFVVNAPNGLYFMHVGYLPTQHINVTAAYGLCNSANPPRCIAPVGGYFITQDDVTRDAEPKWLFTGSSYYNPEPITSTNTRPASAEFTFQNISTNLPPPLLNNATGSDKDFSDELNEFFKNVTSSIPNFGSVTQINATVLDLKNEMDILQEVVKALNESYIDLKELGNYTYYEKWPWYIWLGFIAGLLALALCVFFLLCCTGCGTSCMGKLKCNRCCDKYEEYDFEPHKIHIH
nr:spike protein [Middle East respiratory syndrome-related coronavirus]